MIASLEGYQDIGEILIQHGANVDLQSQVSVHILCMNLLLYVNFVNTGWKLCTYAGSL